MRTLLYVLVIILVLGWIAGVILKITGGLIHLVLLMALVGVLLSYIKSKKIESGNKKRSLKQE
jgi:hypothetical protein